MLHFQRPFIHLFQEQYKVEAFGSGSQAALDLNAAVDTSEAKPALAGDYQTAGDQVFYRPIIHIQPTFLSALSC